MVVSPVASSTDQEIFAPYQLIGELGSRPSPVYVVRDVAPSGKLRLLVAEHFAGVLQPIDGPFASFASEARRISTLASPTVARVRQLSVRGDDLVVYSDFVDGEKLAETWISGTMPLEVALRVILDVLSGVGAIHGLKDAKHQPMQLAHGEVSTATIVFGVDGVARVLHPIARRFPDARSEEASLGYLAVEVHAGGAYDARADVFGAGVLLWEALSGKRLFSESDAAAIIDRTRRGIAPAAIPDKALWAKGLIQVAAKALAWSPDDRWPSAAAMAAEVRKVAGLKLASAIAAAAFAQSAMGERVKARRDRIESAAVARRHLPRLNEEERTTVVVPVASPAPTVEEVGAEADVELVPETVPPPALSPPPLPARAFHASPAAGDDEIVIDVPISIPPPPASVDAFEVSPTSVEQPYEVEPEHRHGRRRIAAVLGGVAAVGVVVFVLAGWRAAQRNTAPSAARVLPAEPVHAQTVRLEAPPSVSASPAPEPSAALVPVSSPPAIAPPPAESTPTSSQSSAAAPLPKISASPPPRPKPPSSRFDPNSL